MKKVQRGGHLGLLKNREEVKRQNTEALWRQVNRLRKEKPNLPWSYKEIWVNAGLRSNVALDSPWNAHIKESIVEHNRKVREERDLGPVGQSERKTLRTTNRDLRQEITRLLAEHSKALSQIAVWEAEATHYQRESQRLQKQLDRLKGLKSAGSSREGLKKTS